MRRALCLIATTAASVLLLAACGDDDDATSSTSSSPTAEATLPADASRASAETITEIVAGNPEFSTLRAAVEAAGLTETLSGDGPFTVFARPTRPLPSCLRGPSTRCFSPRTRTSSPRS